MEDLKKLTIEELAIELTRHADDLQLYANGISEDAIGELAATEEAIYELMRALYEKYQERGLRMDYRTVKYLDALKRKIQEIRDAVFEEIEEDMETSSREIAETENGFLTLFFGLLTGATVSAATQSRLDAISKYGIYNGNTRQQIFDRLAGGDATRIYDAMVDALQKGMSFPDAMAAVKREFMKSRRFLKSEVDSIVNGVVNDAILEFAAANKASLVYSAVLDNRVCNNCAELDGKIFSYNDRDIPSLPRHNNCRCVLVLFQPGGDKVEPATFAEYLKSLTPTEQRARLGQLKYAAWQNGQYKLKNYEPPAAGQRLSADEIITRYRENLQIP